MPLLQLFRKGFFTTAIILVVAVQVLNISIDPMDNLTGARDVAVNEIESCLEFLLEVVMKKTGAIEETDEKDEATDRSLNIILLYLNSIRQLVADTKPHIAADKIFISNSPQFPSLNLPVTSPPPKLI